MNIRQLVIGLLITLMTMGAWRPTWSQEAPIELPTAQDPAVELLLATKPQTPAELTRAAKILADLGRPDLARDFLGRVLAGNLNQGQLTALEGEFGSVLFIQLASRKNLLPEGKQLADLVRSAVERELRDPARLAGLIDQLGDPSVDARFAAMNELRRARGGAVGPLLAVLADSTREGEHANVGAALAGLGRDAVDPLIAVLDSGDPALTAQAIGVLADIKTPRTAVHLLGPFASSESGAEVRQAAAAGLVKLLGAVPTKARAAAMLGDEAGQYFEHVRVLREDIKGNVVVWSWDEAASQPRQATVPRADASLVAAFRLARGAYLIDPTNETYRRLHLATTLERAAYATGRQTRLVVADNTPAGQAAKFGPRAIEDVLQYAMETNHAAAATAAADLLGQIGTAEELLLEGAEAGPLARATQHTDRRLRMAAVEAIFQLDPDRPFPGSSYIPETLLFFASTKGTPRALVAGVKIAEAVEIGGHLPGLGYAPEATSGGRELVRAAIASSDYHFVLVDAAIGRPTVDLLVQQLRRDCRTADLPIGITARDGQLRRAEHIAQRDAMTEAFSRPHDRQTIAWQVDRLLALSARDAVLPEERLRHSARALELLAQLLESDHKVYQARIDESAFSQAVYVPQLGAKVVAVLANLGRPSAQSTLVELASRSNQPLALRQAAAKAFMNNVVKHGVLLSSQEILLQYDRYNNSQQADRETQAVLESLLNSIEAPTAVDQPEE